MTTVINIPAWAVIVFDLMVVLTELSLIMVLVIIVTSMFCWLVEAWSDRRRRKLENRCVQLVSQVERQRALIRVLLDHSRRLLAFIVKARRHYSFPLLTTDDEIRLLSNLEQQAESALRERH